MQQQKPALKIVRLDELAAIEARVQIAIAKASRQHDNALRFVGFLCDRKESADHLQKFGYTVDKAAKNAGKKLPDAPAAKKKDAPRELTVYSGSMLRPAIEEALIEFEKKENCKITRVYNGCGILVTQMKAARCRSLFCVRRNYEHGQGAI